MNKGYTVEICELAVHTPCSSHKRILSRSEAKTCLAFDCP